jgi:hypothetical protein
MIPEKETAEKKESQKDKSGSFSLFDVEHFLRRIIRNWYWFVFMLLVGYAISWVYGKYYAQNIYASDLSLSVSNNTASYFTPNQSINFIWGQGRKSGWNIFKENAFVQIAQRISGERIGSFCELLYQRSYKIYLFG